MRKPPNYQSWATLRRATRNASEEDLLEMYRIECETFRRKYVIIRLIGAYLSKVRRRMKKGAKV